MHKPGLAIVANCVTPYRVNLHRLIAAGIPELKLHTLISHGPGEFDWKVDVPVEINVRHFGNAGDSPLATLYQGAVCGEWRKGGQLIEYLQQHDVRAVMCGLPRYLSYLRVVLFCHRVGLPAFVYSDANIQNERWLSPLKKAVKARFHPWWLRRVSGVMPMGEFGEQYFQQYGVERKRMYRVPCTPDYDSYASVEPVGLQRFRQKYGLRMDRRYLVFSGRLVRAKRVDLLIDAFVRMAVDRPAWSLMIVGDGVLREELGRRVPEHLRSRVVWTGFLDRDEPALAYHSADVLVLPSDQEPWALVVQEAMAAGLAVIASDVVAAARELIEDGVSGRIFAAGDVESLCRAMLDVTDEQRLDDYRQRARTALRSWRKRTDPVAEIRRALTDFGVLSQPSPEPTGTSPSAHIAAS